jgi:hypothetical protein
MEEVFKESFPGVNPGGDPLLHMRSKLRGMDTVSVSMPIFSEEKRVLFILYDISSRLPASLDLHVTQLIIDQNSATLKGTTSSYNNVNTIEKILEKSQLYSGVKIEESSTGKDGIRFKINLQLVGTEGESSS